MSEHKDNPNSVLKAELTEEQKKYQAEMQAKQEEFKKLLETPIDADEAAKRLAENEVNRCRIRAFIEQCSAQVDSIQLKINNARAQLVDLDGEDAILKRRALNKKA